ncbi:hypothetical protein ACTXT7_010445 [Hymenolepis weldensis]
MEDFEGFNLPILILVKTWQCYDFRRKGVRGMPYFGLIEFKLSSSNMASPQAINCLTRGLAKTFTNDKRIKWTKFSRDDALHIALLILSILFPDRSLLYLTKLISFRLLDKNSNGLHSFAPFRICDSRHSDPGRWVKSNLAYSLFSSD